MFHLSWTAHLSDTDAAGVLYFTRLMDAAHRAYEAWLAERGWPVARILEERRFGLPIVHAEADYRLPVRVGERLDIQMQLQQVSERGFSTHYRMVKDDGICAGEVHLVHAVVDANGRGAPLPPELAEALKAPGNENAPPIQPTGPGPV